MAKNKPELDKEEEQEETKTQDQIYDSVYAKWGIHDVPTLMKTALNLESKQGGGIFTRMYNNYNQKVKEEVYKNVENNPVLKRYFMPKKSNVTQKDVDKVRESGAETEKHNKSLLAGYEQKYIDVDAIVNADGTASIIRTPKKDIDSDIPKDKNGKGPSATTVLRLTEGVVPKASKMQSEIDAGVTKTVKTISELDTKLQNEADKPGRRILALDELANAEVKRRRKAAEEATASITKPIKEIGKAVSSIGGAMQFGRDMRRGR